MGEREWQQGRSFIAGCLENPSSFLSGSNGTLGMGFELASALWHGIFLQNLPLLGVSLACLAYTSPPCTAFLALFLGFCRTLHSPPLVSCGEWRSPFLFPFLVPSFVRWRAFLGCGVRGAGSWEAVVMVDARVSDLWGFFSDR